MLIISPQKVADEGILLKRTDFDELVRYANKVEKIMIHEDEAEYSLQDIEQSLRDVWDNEEDETVWQKYL